MHSKMMTSVVPRILTVLLLCSALPTASASAQAAAPFGPSPLVALGDTVKYGSYVVYKIGDGIYKINDPGVTTGKGGAWGVDMYLICGDTRALMIDLGNNYMEGYAKDVIAPRKNAAQELREVVSGLAGKRPLEIAITHAHPDHDGMTGAFLDGKATLWMSDGEDKTALQTQHGVDPSVYRFFTAGKKAFDLGGGRVVETIPVRGHSNGGTVYLLKKDMLLFSGDALGSGFGQAFRSVDRLKVFAEDTRALVDYVSSNFTPYERYALRVYTGHTWQNVYGGFMGPNKDKVDVGYLDWRFVQNVASCANGILGGKWLVEGSGLNHVGNMAYTDAWPGAAGQAIMVYGIGTIIIPLEAAYEAAGLKMPK
jgi:glyoxylase-like metal-dependent hydrolase (beta-lactamase superfamily II)